MLAAGQVRLGQPFNSAPEATPAFAQADMRMFTRSDPPRWNRLLASRWDSQHYIGTLLRGYSLCPPEDLRNADLRSKLTHCGFNFYPGYSAAGWAVSQVTGMPADYALFALSLGSSFAFAFLFTSPAIVTALGLLRTYLALFFFATFVTSFALVTNQTEPCVLFSIVGAFIALRRKYYLLGAVLAGTAGAMRVTGGAVGAAYFIALLVETWNNADSRSKRWLRLLVAAPISQWGQLAVMGYFFVRYSDPLLYVHAHSQAYAHDVSLLDALLPSAKVVLRSLTSGHHEGIFIAANLLWLALGLRRALRGFSWSGRAYWLVLSGLCIGISMLGSAGLSFAGMNRYWLMVLPLFFSLATVMARHPIAAALWTVFTLWHYWNVDLCVYLAQWESASLCPIGYVP
jgi:hypothetical protein